MDQKIVHRIRVLKKEIHESLANRLTYPKTIISISGEKELTEDEWEKARKYIDEAIAVVDVKLSEFLDELERTP